MLWAALVFLVLLAFGMPVAYTIGIAGLTFFLLNPDIPLEIMTQRVVASSQSFTLLAIPLFVFAGNLMNNTGITERLVKLASVLVGHMYGSLAQVSTVLSTLMGGVSGSANADAAMQSRILGPEMTKLGYKKGYSAAINGVSSLITATIPPSMGLIIYGSVGDVSIGRLFAAGIVPGFMMMVALMITVRFTAKRRNYAPQRSAPAKLPEIGRSMIDGIWALLFPIILIVGIRFGVFTPSESGAFACVYAIVIGVFVYRELTWKKFVETVRGTARDIGVIMILVALSGIISYGVVLDQVPKNMSQFLVEVTNNPVVLLILIIIMILIAGMFIETTVVVLLMAPILVPVVTAIGFDPVAFGVIMMSCVTLGIMTPPVGIALYTTSSIMGTTPQETAKESLPFIGAVMVVVALMVAFPQIVLFIPNMIFG